MSGGGAPDRTTQVTEPWSGARPYLLDNFSQTGELASQAPSYYGGPLSVGALPQEQAAFQQRANYADSVFGQSPSLRYGDATQALPNYLNGNTGLGQLSQQMAPGATNAMQSSFAQGPSQLGGNRPIPELGQYRTPIDGLYLCGASSHPGGSIICRAIFQSSSGVQARSCQRRVNERRGTRSRR